MDEGASPSTGDLSAFDTSYFGRNTKEARENKTLQRIAFATLVHKFRSTLFGDPIVWTEEGPNVSKEDAWRAIAEGLQEYDLFRGKSWMRIRDHEWQYVRRHAVSRFEANNLATGALGELDAIVLDAIGPKHPSGVGPAAASLSCEESKEGIGFPFDLFCAKDETAIDYTSEVVKEESRADALRALMAETPVDDAIASSSAAAASHPPEPRFSEPLVVLDDEDEAVSSLSVLQSLGELFGLNGTTPFQQPRPTKEKHGGGVGTRSSGRRTKGKTPPSAEVSPSSSSAVAVNGTAREAAAIHGGGTTGQRGPAASHAAGIPSTTTHQTNHCQAAVSSNTTSPHSEDRRRKQPLITPIPPKKYRENGYGIEASPVESAAAPHKPDVSLCQPDAPLNLRSEMDALEKEKKQLEIRKLQLEVRSLEREQERAEQLHTMEMAQRRLRIKLMLSSAKGPSGLSSSTVSSTSSMDAQLIDLIDKM